MTTPESTRSALPLMTQGGSGKSAMCRGSGCVPLEDWVCECGFVEREVVNMAVEGHATEINSIA